MMESTQKQRVGDVVRSSTGSAGDDIDQAIYAIEQQAGWQSIGRLSLAHAHLLEAKANTDAALASIGPDPSTSDTEPPA